MPRFERVEDVLRAVEAHFLAEKAANVEVVGGLHLEGEGGGDWVLRIADERLTITPGTPKEADAMHLSASVADFLAMANGELDPTRAYFTGKVRFKGHLKQAYQLMDIFRMPKD